MEFVNGVGMTSRIWNGQEKLFETTNQPTKRRRIELVGGIPTPLKNISHMKVSWDYELPNIWKNKKCSKLVGGFNHFEKRRWDDIPYMKWKRKTVWNHQPANRKAKKFSESKATHPAWLSGLAFRRSSWNHVPGTPLHHPVVDGHDLVLKGNLWKPVLTWANPIYIYNMYNKSWKGMGLTV